MSKVYKCDCCEGMINNPHKAKMKEFYYTSHYELCGSHVINIPRKTKDKKHIHLCENCYKQIAEISRKIRSDANDT